MSIPIEAVIEVLKKLSRDIRELDVGSSADRHCTLPALHFLRDYVASNKPVVLTDVVSHWPALSTWTNEYLCKVAGDAEVTVALTPNGRADAVTPLPCGRAEERPHSRGRGEGGRLAAAAKLGSRESGLDAAEGAATRPVAPRGDCFALPHQVTLPLRDFLALLQPGVAASSSSSSSTHGCQQQEPGCGAIGRPSPQVPYLQYQNSSLTAELPQLLGDVDSTLAWASEAFGGPPEAVNLWIGDQRSITSWHKDPFENIYAVVAGSKTFSLMPPADAFRMRLRRYPQATYVAAGAAAASSGSGGVALSDVLSGSLRLEPVLKDPAEEVLWSSVAPPAGAAANASPATDAAAAGDLFSEPSLQPPLRVTVQAGEVLYLPAMWWHQVEQEPDAEGRAIAVNYWYDMKFDARYAYLGAVERLAELTGLNQSPPPHV